MFSSPFPPFSFTCSNCHTQQSRLLSPDTQSTFCTRCGLKINVYQVKQAQKRERRNQNRMNNKDRQFIKNEREIDHIKGQINSTIQNAFNDLQYEFDNFDNYDWDRPISNNRSNNNNRRTNNNHSNNRRQSPDDFNFDFENNEEPQYDSMFSINIPNANYNRNARRNNNFTPMDLDFEDEFNREMEDDIYHQSLRDIIERESQNMEEIIRNVSAANDIFGSIHQLNRETQPKPKPKLKKEEMSKKMYVKNDKGVLEQPTCCICLNNMKLKDLVSRLPCKHIIHYKCLEKWCEVKTECPFCRATIK